MKTQPYADYAAHHSDARNRLTRAFGLRSGPIDLAVAAAVAVLLYYAAIPKGGAFISAMVFALLYGAAIRFRWEVNLGAFIFGGVLQTSVTVWKRTVFFSRTFRVVNTIQAAYLICK